jgi:hypothetical protein
MFFFAIKEELSFKSVSNKTLIRASFKKHFQVQHSCYHLNLLYDKANPYFSTLKNIFNNLFILSTHNDKAYM